MFEVLGGVRSEGRQCFHDMVTDLTVSHLVPVSREWCFSYTHLSPCSLLDTQAASAVLQQS